MPPRARAVALWHGIYTPDLQDDRGSLVRYLHHFPLKVGVEDEWPA